MRERSELRLRVRPHIHPERQQETIVEIVRAGEVVATLYGSREGVHIVSDRVLLYAPFRFETDGVASLVVPLLADGESCPWCQGSGQFGDHPCPVCARRPNVPAK